MVVWEHAVFDDMGMTGALGTHFGVLDGQNALRVLAPGHPLAAGLSGAPVVTTSLQPFAWGRPGAAAVNAAALTGDSTRSGVFGYEAGAAMFGLSAPARRVGLFLGNSGVSPLNPDGAEALRRRHPLGRRRPPSPAAASAPPPPASAATSPGENALLVVSNAAAVGAGDAAVRARLEGLGYAVTVRSESAAASEAAGKDVVVISATVASGAVNSKFRATAVPVVVWEHAVFDDMGMTGVTLGTHFGVLDGQNALRVLAPGHPLAAGLSGAPVVTTSLQPFTWGRPGAAAVNAAALTGDSTRSGVFGYTTGAAMFGLSAPARRVGLFLGNSGVSPLNPDGPKLFDAAIRWADG